MNFNFNFKDNIKNAISKNYGKAWQKCRKADLNTYIVTSLKENT